MKLYELKENAKKILELSIPKEGFENISFTKRSGGYVKNYLNLPEVSRSSEFQYSTVANGDAYSGETVICCKDTGTKDVNGRTIYITPEGITFIYHYSPGDPSSFDGGALKSPVLELKR